MRRMDTSILLKALAGFAVVLVIQLFAHSRLYYISALVPLFPSLAIFSYYFVGSMQDQGKLQETIVFGMISLLTYFCFLLTLLIDSRHMKIVPALFVASAIWFAAAGVQFHVWPHIKPALGFRQI